MLVFRCVVLSCCGCSVGCVSDTPNILSFRYASFVLRRDSKSCNNGQKLSKMLVGKDGTSFKGGDDSISFSFFFEEKRDMFQNYPPENERIRPPKRDHFKRK